MSDSQITAKTIAIVVLAAIVTAVVMTLVQVLILDKANVAVTGAVVGTVTAVMVIKTLKRKPE